MKRGLGTQLRLLVELLDGAVAEAYRREGIHYRPRYFPVMQALTAHGPLSVTEIAQAAGITQPAATQTVALMVRDGLVAANQSKADSRQKVIKITSQGEDLLPRLQACWDAVAAAANALDSDLPFALSELLDLAIEVLGHNSFDSRIQAAARGKTPRVGLSKQTTTQGVRERLVRKTMSDGMSREAAE